MDGSIDDVRIYNRALSAEEVEDLYEAGLAESVETSNTPEFSDINLDGVVNFGDFNILLNNWLKTTDKSQQ